MVMMRFQGSALQAGAVSSVLSSDPRRTRARRRKYPPRSGTEISRRAEHRARGGTPQLVLTIRLITITTLILITIQTTTTNNNINNTDSNSDNNNYNKTHINHNNTSTTICSQSITLDGGLVRTALGRSDSPSSAAQCNHEAGSAQCALVQAICAKELQRNEAPMSLLSSAIVRTS